jgi:hypothetical protein
MRPHEHLCAGVFGIFERIAGLISGEWLLKRRANGGTVILARAVIASVGLYVIAIGISELFRPTASWAPSWQRFQTVVHETIPWFGAVFAAVYAGLYARFASQWAYLAGLYNQVMEFRIEFEQDEAKCEKLLAAWKAAFIEDAEDLHLVTKPAFALAIRNMLKDKPVGDMYVEHCPRGQDGLDSLNRRLDDAIRDYEQKRRRER